MLNHLLFLLLIVVIPWLQSQDHFREAVGAWAGSFVSRPSPPVIIPRRWLIITHRSISMHDTTARPSDRRPEQSRPCQAADPHSG
jgi:hypothetical protein